MKHPVIDYYLSDDYDLMKSKGEFSCLMLALRDARSISGRDEKTGIVINTTGNFSPHKWPAALLYLIILEQLGTCLKPTSSNLQGYPIYLTLRYFSDLAEKECKAIAALRHSFSHSFALFNIYRDNKTQILDTGKTHVFRLIADELNPLIIIPNDIDAWDGIFPIKNRKSITFINIWKLGDLVEEIVCNVRKEYAEDNIELLISEEELKYKYITAMI